MAEIISIATSVPANCHQQQEILRFMQDIYELDNDDKRKLSFLYKHSGIRQRYSVIKDYGIVPEEWSFIPRSRQDIFPPVERRMLIYQNEALQLSLNAIHKCIAGFINAGKITHLITVSCTGMSAPGLDLQLVEQLQLAPDIFRTSVNFMGCYAAVHGLKLAKMICDTTPAANVVIVSTELCTLHFQQEYTIDNAASSLLFADGCAAALVSNCILSDQALSLKNFYSKIAFRGKNDMAWEISSKGFLMTLTGYIPDLIQEDIQELVTSALKNSHLEFGDISHWCIHPGGKKILDTIQKKLNLQEGALDFSRKVLSNYGNMSSPTILFVLKEIMEEKNNDLKNVFGVAFGPGLTMETFIASRS